MQSGPWLLVLSAVMASAAACQSEDAPDPPDADSPSSAPPVESVELPHAPRPGLPLPAGFDVRVSATAASDSTVRTAIEVDIPEGSYVISALSNRGYMGKFSVTWTDTTLRPASALVESPVSMPGWEPFDKVYTPMLFAPTVITQDWQLPDSTGPFEGEVFFVLEPQCVPYALNFTMEKVGLDWFTQAGLVHPAYPE